MSGIVRGRIDCLANEASNSIYSAQAKFKTLFDFLSGLPGWSRIAWYAGDVSGNIPKPKSRGMDYYDGESPFGHAAFGVFQVKGTSRSWCCLIQFSDSHPLTIDPGNGNGSPAFLRDGHSGIGIQMAWAMDDKGNDTSPWNGTTGNDGGDKKGGGQYQGTAVWGCPDGGVLRILPRSNGMGPPVGAYYKNFEGLSHLGASHHKFSAYVPHRFHMLADQDTLLFLEDYGDKGSTSMTYAGVYLPRPGIVVPHPFVLVHQNKDDQLLSVTTSRMHRYGPLEYGDDRMDGGVALPNDAPVRSVCFDRMEGFTASAMFQPNSLANEFDEWAIACGVNEPESGIAGWLGYLDPSLVRETFGMNNRAYNEDKSRAYFGNSLTNRLKYSVFWDGKQTPGTNATREGIVL